MSSIVIDAFHDTAFLCRRADDTLIVCMYFDRCIICDQILKCEAGYVLRSRDIFEFCNNRHRSTIVAHFYVNLCFVYVMIMVRDRNINKKQV